MQIKSVKVENFLSQNYNSSSFVLDPKDLSTLFGINDGNCRSAFRALAFAADILLWKYRDVRSYIRSYFPVTNRAKHMKVSIGLTFDIKELDMISDFVIASEIPRIRSMNDHLEGCKAKRRIDIESRIKIAYVSLARFS
jgi:hypothetical protein